jgi:hypothetical protein
MKRRGFFAAVAAIAISPLAVAKLSPSDKMRNLMRNARYPRYTHRGRFDYTDLYISPENLKNMRNWGVDEISEDLKKDMLCS